MPTEILVVDDERDMEAMFELRFRQAVGAGEMVFEFAHDGYAALEKIKENSKIEIVLCDNNMPRMNGLSLLQELQRLRRNLKVVMVSAYGDLDNIRAAMNLGAFDFVTKPIDFDDLRATISKTEEAIAERRKLLDERDAAVLARSNLSRYFPPNIVDRLAETDNPLAEAREQSAAVLFVDIFGFTKFCASAAPERAFRALRLFLDIMSQIVFQHDGTLDKFVGDGLMATFGTPDTGPQDAADAVRCAFAMRDANAAMNLQGGKDAVSFDVAIGVHWGPVFMGNVGSSNRMEFAVVGDTVNVASRLESAARDLGCSIVISDTALQTALEQELESPGELVDRGNIEIRGHDQAVHVWSA
ncbi:MAG: adenylate/guanylate cyclase domain-containing protein [Alphaproteobacteria bacterium]|nr:adenylate/guanylate cyclase domain-containing protein [Alphaproteobacteria bacterium]